MTRFHLTAVLLFVSAATVQADDARAKPEVTPMLIQAAEEKYATEVAKAESVVTKAEADLAKARKAAGETRLKAYKERLAEITKTGDFDKAVAVKARIEQLESEIDSDPAKLKRKLPGGIKIISATYGVNQSWLDVTDKVEHFMSGKTVIVSDELFGDAAPEYQPGNTLVVRYERKGALKLTAIYSGKPLILP